MNTDRLAKFFEFKYNLKSEGASSDDQRINDVRQAILDAYNNYINVDSKDLKPAYNIVPLLAEAGEKFSKQIIALMEDLINDIDTVDLHDLLGKVNNVLAVIGELQDSKNKEVRDSIHDVFKARRQTNINQREMAKSKFENVVFKKLASILEKQGNLLKRMVGNTTPLMGGASEPQVKDPSQQDLFMFKLSPVARKYRLDDAEVWSKIWSMPEFRRRITYIINSAKKRNVDLRHDETVAAETAEIMEAYKARTQTNEKFFEASEDVAKEVMRPPFVSPELKKEMLTEKYEQQAERDMQFEQLQQQIKQRDEGWARRQLEDQENAERHLKSDGSSHLEQIMKRYQ